MYNTFISLTPWSCKVAWLLVSLHDYKSVDASNTLLFPDFVCVRRSVWLVKRPFFAIGVKTKGILKHVSLPIEYQQKKFILQRMEINQKIHFQKCRIDK